MDPMVTRQSGFPVPQLCVAVSSASCTPAAALEKDKQKLVRVHVLMQPFCTSFYRETQNFFLRSITGSVDLVMEEGKDGLNFYQFGFQNSHQHCDANVCFGHSE